ncbi:MAG: hypothetical protein WKF97_01575 [Chitinophagaceae bacterium]
MQHTNVRYEGTSFTINSRLSFKLLIESWKEKIAEDKDGLREFYGDLLESLSAYPEVLEPINDLSILKDRQPLIEKMMTSIFPVTLSDKKDLYAISIPFTYKTIYSSALFKSIFLNESGDMIMVPDPETERVISEQKIIMSYQMILTKFYGFELRGDTTTVHPFLDPVTGLQKYLQLELNSRFIEVKAKGKLPDLGQNQTCIRLKDLLKIPRLQVLLPLDLFEFEGFVIINIKDVTEREVISDIKNRLLTVHSFADIHAFASLQEQMQKLIGLSDVRIGIAPFFKINNHYVFSDQFSQNSFILKHIHSQEEKTRICLKLIQLFQKHDDFLVISSITPEVVRDYPFLRTILEEGGKSLIICPLRSGKELIGVLSFLSNTPGMLGYSHIQKIEPAIPLFVLALEKSAEILNNQIDRVIKEQFTAVQSSVEWKFTEAALSFLTKKSKGDDSKIENIVFEDVYPLYGSNRYKEFIHRT